MQDMQFTYKRNNEWCSRNNCSPGKAINITHVVYMSVALGIQPAKRLCRITLSSASCPAVPHVSSLSHKRQDFRKSVIEHKIGFWLLQKPFF
jgi:hypothetical protein